MKNFFDIKEISNISCSLLDLIETCLVDLKEYFKLIPPTEENKLKSILSTDIIRMYYIPIRYSQGEGLPERDLDEVFNLSVDSVEENHENGTGLKAKEIESLVDMNYYYCPTLFFSNTLSLLSSKIHSSWIIFYKNGAIVHPHDHDDTTILVHILLNDIENGEFVIKVKEDEKRINKKGDYFIFCGGNTHQASFSGNEAIFLTFAIEYKDINTF